MSYGLHGLRLIANATYEPTGRDWFFTGDYYYRNGRRTPGPQDRWKAYSAKDIPREPRGPPKEMRRQKSQPLLKRFNADYCEAPTACPASQHIARWRCLKEGPRRAAEAPEGTESEAASKRSSLAELGRFLGTQERPPPRAVKYALFSERVAFELPEEESTSSNWRTTYQDALPDPTKPCRASKYPFFSERMPLEETTSVPRCELFPHRHGIEPFSALAWQWNWRKCILLGHLSKSAKAKN